MGAACCAPTVRPGLFFGLFQVAEEVGFGVEQKRTVCEVMIGDFVSADLMRATRSGWRRARSPIRKNVAWALCWCKDFEAWG